MTEQASFRLEVVDGVPVIVVGGEIDLANVDQFKSFVTDAAAHESGSLIVSLRAVSYLDSHTLEVLADLGKRLRTNRQRLLISAPRDCAAGHILRLTGIDLAVEVFENDDEALASLR